MIIHGDAKAIPLGDCTIDCVVTSPPYYNLRDYGTDGQIGAEHNPDDYLNSLSAVFCECGRVLKDTGTLFLNLGDTYGKRKSLVGIPWLAALRLKEDGWILRSDIIWHKPNPMPESAKDRPTRAHEYVFVLTKKERYFWNQKREKGVLGPHKRNRATNFKKVGSQADRYGSHNRGNPIIELDGYRNPRSVLTINKESFSGAHCATMPTALARWCVSSGTPTGGTVLDPFMGSGSTGVACALEGRPFVGVDISAEYCEIARRRIAHAEAQADEEAEAESRQAVLPLGGDA